tara:strand:- start:903 stop:1091 length:189 start_codon:yes stop_codon:yes gene_type:complete
MTYNISVTSNSMPPRAKLHQFWVRNPDEEGKNMAFWGFSKDEAYQKAQKANPQASISWKKRL